MKLVATARASGIKEGDESLSVLPAFSVASPLGNVKAICHLLRLLDMVGCALISMRILRPMYQVGFIQFAVARFRLKLIF